MSEKYIKANSKECIFYLYRAQCDDHSIQRILRTHPSRY